MTEHDNITDRRPGLPALVDKLLRANPKWSRRRALARAKVLWTERQPVGHYTPAKLQAQRDAISLDEVD